MNQVIQGYLSYAPAVGTVVLGVAALGTYFIIMAALGALVLKYKHKSSFKQAFLLLIFWNEIEEWVRKRKHAWLLKHDYAYRMNAAEREVVRERDIFYKNGGKPFDPGCPDIFTVLEEWGFDPLKPLPDTPVSKSAK